MERQIIPRIDLEKQSRKTDENKEILLEERERESARNKILRDPLTATCDGGTFWRASEFEKRNATRKKKENDDGTR